MSEERKREFVPLMGQYELLSQMGRIEMPEPWRSPMKDADWMVYEYWGKMLMKLGPESILDMMQSEYSLEKVRIICRGKVCMDENGLMALPGPIETKASGNTVKLVGMYNHLELWV